jgi:carboxymethylenebutenolidase
MSGFLIEDISLNVSDGTTMAAFVARPKDSEKHPGILVFQEAFGVNPHIREIAGRFAEEGFISIAPELFHRTAKGFIGNYNDFESVREHVRAVSNDSLIADITSVYDWLRNEKRLLSNEVASIGFCMGGRVSFLANTLVSLKASISFYGGGIPGLLDRIPGMQAPMLMFWGGLDKHLDENQVNAVTAALKLNNKNYVNVVFSNADHGFFNNERSIYNPDAANQAWALSKEFLNSYVLKS